MSEYLIRTLETHEWPPIHRDRLAEVLAPEGWPCQQIEGWGDLRLICDGTEIAFSGEEVGWQVTVDGPMATDDVDRVIAVVTSQVGREVGKPCESLSFG
jgi:hypothetical protein